MTTKSTSLPRAPARLRRRLALASAFLVTSIAGLSHAECTREAECKVDVTITAEDSRDSYHVRIAGFGECTTPCTLRAFPGHWGLEVDGSGHLSESIDVPPAGADVKLGGRSRPRWSSTMVTLGEATGGVLMVGGAAGVVVGDIWATHPGTATQGDVLVAIIGGFVVGLTGMVGFIVSEQHGRDSRPVDDVDVEVIPKIPAAAHRVRFIGLGAREIVGSGSHESATRTLVPVVTFEFE
jgi:hypothetical protein